MPSKTNARPVVSPADRERIHRRKKVPFTDSEVVRLREEAKAAGMTEAKYMRQAVLACWGETPKPKRRACHDDLKLTHNIGLLAFQVKKLGTNVNQLAKQANTGLVPVSRAEVQYLLNQHQMLLTRAIAAIEAVLA